MSEEKARGGFVNDGVGLSYVLKMGIIASALFATIWAGGIILLYNLVMMTVSSSVTVINLSILLLLEVFVCSAILLYFLRIMWKERKEVME